MEEGARRFLNELDDLSVDVPKAPVLVRALGLILSCSALSVNQEDYTAGRAASVHAGRPARVSRSQVAILFLTCAAQMGEALGGLVAGGGADLAVIAEHIRTADANPDEIWEVRSWGWGGGGVARSSGSLLPRGVVTTTRLRSALSAA